MDIMEFLSTDNIGSFLKEVKDDEQMFINDFATFALTNLTKCLRSLKLIEKNQVTNNLEYIDSEILDKIYERIIENFTLDKTLIDLINGGRIHGRDDIPTDTDTLVDLIKKSIQFKDLMSLLIQIDKISHPDRYPEKDKKFSDEDDEDKSEIFNKFAIKYNVTLNPSKYTVAKNIRLTNGSFFISIGLSKTLTFKELDKIVRDIHEIGDNHILHNFSSNKFKNFMDNIHLVHNNATLRKSIEEFQESGLGTLATDIMIYHMKNDAKLICYDDFLPYIRAEKHIEFTELLKKAYDINDESHIASLNSQFLDSFILYIFECSSLEKMARYFPDSGLQVIFQETLKNYIINNTNEFSSNYFRDPRFEKLMGKDYREFCNRMLRGLDIEKLGKRSDTTNFESLLETYGENIHNIMYLVGDKLHHLCDSDLHEKSKKILQDYEYYLLKNNLIKFSLSKYFLSRFLPDCGRSSEDTEKIHEALSKANTLAALKQCCVTCRLQSESLRKMYKLLDLIENRDLFGKYLPVRNYKETPYPVEFPSKNFEVFEVFKFNAKERAVVEEFNKDFRTISCIHTFKEMEEFIKNFLEYKIDITDEKLKEFFDNPDNDNYNELENLLKDELEADNILEFIKYYKESKNSYIRDKEEIDEADFCEKLEKLGLTSQSNHKKSNYKKSKNQDAISLDQESENQNAIPAAQYATSGGRRRPRHNRQVEGQDSIDERRRNRITVSQIYNVDGSKRSKSPRRRFRGR